jgi:hypothetical protein
MKYFKSLNILNDCFDQEKIINSISNVDSTKLGMWKLEQVPFNDYFVNWLSDAGCQIFFTELFYTPPYRNLVWHIDSNQPSNFVKINFIWGSQKHHMQWGELISPRSVSVKETVANTEYIEFKDYEIKILESTTIINPTIVNVGVPHRVVNIDNTGRWCLSAVIHNNDQRVQFDDAVKLFSEYVLD